MDIYSLMAIERYSVTIGLSVLNNIAYGQLLDHPTIKIAVPDNLLRLVSLARDGSKEHQEFLYTIASEFGETQIDLEAQEFAMRLGDRFSYLLETGILVAISDEDLDVTIEEFMDESFSNDRYFISLSPKSNFVKEYYLKVLSWAENKGSLIIEKTSYSFRNIGHYITTLQLPDRFDSIVDSKKKHIDKVFSFKGGKSTKWFIAALFGTAGFIHPVLGLPGLLLAYMDP